METNRDVEGAAQKPFKVCTCCKRTISQKDWGRLKLIGFQVDEVERLEMRDCYCGSTLAVSKPTREAVSPQTEVRS